MRTIVLLVWICALTRLGAQPVVQFTEPTNRWSVVETSNANLEGELEWWTDVYANDGDTLIMGQSWMRVVGSDGWLDTGPDLLGYTRQEGEVVFFRAPGEQPDTLYDYSLQVGDSMEYKEQDYTFHMHLTAIDTVLIAEAPHRRYHFAPYGAGFCYLSSEQWIEGLGSLRGSLFPALAKQFCGEYFESATLSCLEQYDTLTWMHPDFTECVVNILLGIRGEEIARVKVYPNPGNYALQVDGIADMLAPSIALFDIAGRAVLTAPLYTGVPVDVSMLPSGAYHYRLQDQHGWRVQGVWIKE